MTDLSVIDFDVEARIEAAVALAEQVRANFKAHSVRPDLVGSVAGGVHPASLLVWNEIADIAGVPYVPADIVARLPVEEVYAILDGNPDPESLTSIHQMRAAGAYAESGGYWRTDLCASLDVKASLHHEQRLPDIIPINFDDPRMMDVHDGVHEFLILKRPRLTPVTYNGWPIEFRVFNGGAAEDGSASWYYPQCPVTPTPELETAMTEATNYARVLHTRRAKLGLVPWFPRMDEPTHEIGSSIDFMLTEERGLVMIDAGPGAGHGAHPCCFIDCEEIAGRCWNAPEGAQLR